jgi:hypothetical protein
MISNFNFDILHIKKEYMGNSLITDQKLLVSNMLEIQAVIRVLTRRGITNEDEVMQEIIKLQSEMDDKVKKLGKEN